MSKAYISGHHESVLRSHIWRTADNSASYLLPYLRSGQTLLDVGCGPGTLTCDLAKRIAPGRAIGIDPSGEVIEKATTYASENGAHHTVNFVTGDILNLTEKESREWMGAFDVVHAHQVLQHLTEPLKALQMMRALAKPDTGLVATRETDFGTWSWWPSVPELDEWRELWVRVAKDDKCDPNIGRRMLSLARQAGWQHDQISVSAGTWCFKTAAEKEWWAGLWAERTLKSTLATKAIEKGFATQEDLERLSQGWLKWGDHDDAIFMLPSVELVCLNGPS